MTAFERVLLPKKKESAAAVCKEGEQAKPVKSDSAESLLFVE